MSEEIEQAIMVGYYAANQLVILGAAYASGDLTLGEFADILSISRSDAVALLDAKGFARSTETIRLSDEERGRILAKLRANRLRRGGKPEPSEPRVLRSVIATQRIEGVDARPWIKE